ARAPGSGCPASRRTAWVPAKEGAAARARPRKRRASSGASGEAGAQRVSWALLLLLPLLWTTWTTWVVMHEPLQRPRCS
ncbi:unnamed protein product, partial [Polarella glacialis]